MSLSFGRSKEDFHYGGESGDRLDRLPSVTKESVVGFRIEIEVHISCITFLVVLLVFF